MSRVFNLTAILLASLCAKSATAQSWSPLANPVKFNATNPLLLTDGSVLVDDFENGNWFRLTPDNTGNYIKGTWNKVVSTPGYAPLYFSAQVMPDGRVFVLGGEYNLLGSGFTNLGYIIDPTKNTATPLSPPSQWSNIGDMGSVMLPNGKILMCWPLGREYSIYDPATNTFTTPTTGGKRDTNDEEGLTLLPNGQVLTVDCYTANGAELFDPTTGAWTPAANTPYNLIDNATSEMGPQVVLTDGTVIAFGANGSNALYNPANNTWTAEPAFPKSGSTQLVCADAGACLLPSGNVLVQTGPGYTGAGAKFFEFNGSSYVPVPGTPNAPGEPGFTGNMLMLPNGQVFYTDESSDIEIYTPTGTPKDAWRPTIKTAPPLLRAGLDYSISGTQFNGLSSGAAYGDDVQGSTSYPIIRLTNLASKHVFYCREHNPSTMGIATGNATVSTHFRVPANIELGKCTIEVIANGIASAPFTTTVYPPVVASGVFVYQGTGGQGALQNIWLNDGLTFSCQSVAAPAGQVAAIEADFNFPVNTANGLSISTSLAAVKGVTGQVYAFNYVSNSFVLLSATFLNPAQTALNASTPTASGSQFISSTGQVRILVRGVLPPHVAPGIFRLAADSINCLVQ